MIDWNDAFDNSGYVPGSADLADIWSARAAAFREQYAAKDLDVRYGDHPREQMDLFYPKSAKGVLIFVHGGYWLKFDKSYFSHLMAGFLMRGWAVAAPTYPLCPDVRIADITQSIGRAITHAASAVAGPIRLAGHSAGGHLVSRMICAGTPLNDAIRKRLIRVTSISGVHDLRPLMHTQMNAGLRIDADEAVSESPGLLRPTGDCPATFWVGAQERPEFLRQTRFAEEAWQRSGLYPEVAGLPPAETGVSAVYDTGHNHFSVVDALTDPLSPITQACLL